MQRLSGSIFVFIITLSIWDIALGSNLPLCKLISAEYNQTSDVESVELLFNTLPEYEMFHIQAGC